MSTWALVGSPNSGKTTLYNWLTGARAKTVNYPGATVEYSVGPLRTQLSEKFDNFQANIIDTPGVYSLNPQSEDERVTYKTLFDRKNFRYPIDGVLVVADGTQLNRHLVLAEQLKESGYPVILIVTMMDLLEKEGDVFNTELLKTKLNIPVVQFDGVLGRGLDHLILLMKQPLKALDTIQAPVWNIEKQKDMLEWAQQASDQVLVKKNKEHNSALKLTAKLDQVFLHPVLGLIIFFLLMTLLFASIYWMAQPIMDAVDGLFSVVSKEITNRIPNLFGDFLGTGLIAAIGGIVIFIPQIFILFLGIGILEATGYLARVGALIDRPLSALGLGGRSFVPVLSGFACAIPAIMATRNITSKKERLIAQSIIPFMTCSARLPVYGLMIGFLFGDENPFKAGFIMAVLYFGGILVGGIASKILSMIVKGEKQSRLMMELPLYRRPRFRIIFLQAFSKAKTFMFRAGPIILVLALVLWFGTNYPRPPAGTEMSPAQLAEQSYAAQVGRAIEPVFKPLGVDWRVGFGLISAFAAREVFVSALALVFNIEGENEVQTKGLQTAMREATFPDGTKIFTVATVVGILIFFMIALQCISTVGILKREAGSWTPALLQLILSNIFAYGLAVVVVNVLKSFGL
ncbi:MAG: ferrous iron transporter B [Bdellovibrionaceae bacterium]|nr:ferrous iron transporter B [Bdellovibrio sp.]